MQQEHFYVSHAGHQEGPISLDEIVARVQSKALDVNDYLYDEQTQDWVTLMAYPRLAERLKSIKPPAPPPVIPPPGQSEKKTAPQEASTEVNAPEKQTEWFVLKGDNKFGPFSYSELVRMLQDKSVYEYDYVWNAQMTSWERIAGIEDFSPEAIKKLRESGIVGLNEVFFRRRHARVPYGASLLVHNNQNVFKGRSLEIGAGGAGLVIDNDRLQPGDRLFLHFKPGEDMPPFNAVCEVVSKRPVSASDVNSPTQYGVKFTHIAKQMQDSIHDFAVKKRAA